MPERRKLTLGQILDRLLPAVILAVLGWICLQVVDIPVIKASVASIRVDLEKHNEDSKSLSIRNSSDHHRKVGMTPCDGCHIRRRE